MKFVAPKCLTPQAKGLVLALVGTALSANVSVIKDKIMPAVAHHPVLSFQLSCVFGIWTLIQNPEVRDAVRKWRPADPQ